MKLTIICQLKIFSLKTEFLKLNLLDFEQNLYSNIHSNRRFLLIFKGNDLVLGD